MNITTKYNIGSTVITYLDGTYEKAKVHAVSVFVRSDTLEPTVRYDLAVQTQLLNTPTRRGEEATFTTTERPTSEIESKLIEHFTLYKSCEAALTDEERKQPMDKRDRLIFWNMRRSADGKNITGKEPKDGKPKTN